MRIRRERDRLELAVHMQPPPFVVSPLRRIIFPDMVCSLPAEWCVAASFCQSDANHVYFFPFFKFRRKSESPDQSALNCSDF